MLNGRSITLTSAKDIGKIIESNCFSSIAIHCELGRDDRRNIIDAIKKNKSLEKLDLSGCSIRDSFFVEVVNALKEKPVRKVRVINFSDNKITKQGIINCGNSLNASGIVDIDLSSNKIISEKEDANHIINFLEKNQNITSINLSKCNINDNCAEQIFDFLGSGDNFLKTLILRDNKISTELYPSKERDNSIRNDSQPLDTAREEDVESVVDDNNTNFSKVDFSDVDSTMEDQEQPKQASGSYLENLDLSGNKITSRSVFKLIGKHSSSLKSIKISNCGLSQSETNSILGKMSECGDLKKVDISHNNDCSCNNGDMINHIREISPLKSLNISGLKDVNSGTLNKLLHQNDSNASNMGSRVTDGFLQKPEKFSLEELAIAKINANEHEIGQIITLLKGHKNITSLDLSDNDGNFSDLFSQTHMKSIVLDRCDIKDDQIEKLDIEQSLNLERLSLKGNNGISQEKLVQIVKKAKDSDSSLNFIDISNCGLKQQERLKEILEYILKSGVQVDYKDPRKVYSDNVANNLVLQKINNREIAEIAEADDIKPTDREEGIFELASKVYKLAKQKFSNFFSGNNSQANTDNSPRDVREYLSGAIDYLNKMKAQTKEEQEGKQEEEQQKQEQEKEEEERQKREKQQKQEKEQEQGQEKEQEQQQQQQKQQKQEQEEEEATRKKQPVKDSDILKYVAVGVACGAVTAATAGAGAVAALAASFLGGAVGAGVGKVFESDYSKDVQVQPKGSVETKPSENIEEDYGREKIKTDNSKDIKLLYCLPLQGSRKDQEKGKQL